MEIPETEEWQIHLAWRQKVAAYWSISWPAWVVSFTLTILLTATYSLDQSKDYAPRISLAATGIFYIFQAMLTQRLVRKNYRSFRVVVIRDGDQHSRRLSKQEAGLVWLRILWPQLAWLLFGSVIVGWFGPQLPDQATRGISALAQWLQLLVIGPYAIALALRARYTGFQLQAYGHRVI